MRREDAVERRAAAVFARVLRLRPAGPAARKRWTAAAIPAWDSLKHVELVLALERAFRARVALDDAVAADSFAALVEAVRRARARRR